MFNKKLDKGDLKELRKREEQINSFVLIVEALRFQKQAFIGSKFSKYGLDSSRAYSISLETGKIKVKKVKQPKNK